jgi:pyridoxal phosphate enzyme (YggS family)
MRIRPNITKMTPTSVHENISRVRGRIAAAAHKAGRRPEDITLIAVSKTHPPEAIRAAFESGLRHFGENRVQEWEGKCGALQDLSATWHLVGHLQSNKAGRAAKVFHTIDSVDDFALAQRLDRAQAEPASDAKLRVLLEVQVAPEASKTGVSPDSVQALAEKVIQLSRLDLAGLMCIPPFLDNPEQVRPFFRRLRELRDSLTNPLGRSLAVLSMGMSHDFEVAIEEGATEVRIGTAIFGARQLK